MIIGVKQRALNINFGETPNPNLEGGVRESFME